MIAYDWLLRLCDLWLSCDLKAFLFDLCDQWSCWLRQGASLRFACNAYVCATSRYACDLYSFFIFVRPACRASPEISCAYSLISQSLASLRNCSMICRASNNHLCDQQCAVRPGMIFLFKLCDQSVLASLGDLLCDQLVLAALGDILCDQWKCCATNINFNPLQ